ncbi:8105_t:CDS:2, partial [Racocetra persica]
KHDGILYYNLNSIKVSVGYMEVVGNAFASNTSDKNSDLEKLLKVLRCKSTDQHAQKIAIIRNSLFVPFLVYASNRQCIGKIVEIIKKFK